MFQERHKKISSIVFIAMLLITIQCTGQNIKSKKNMQQLYYTQEGTPYVLKSASLNTTFAALVPLFLTPKLIVNSPIALVNPNPLDIVYIETSTPIIPLMCMYSMMNISGVTPVVTMELAMPYYNLIDETAIATDYNYFKALSKIAPNVELIYRDAGSPRLITTYGLKYNQIVFSDYDFLSPIYSSYNFTPNQTDALTGYVRSFSPLPIPANYAIAMTVLYFERFKK